MRASYAVTNGMGMKLVILPLFVFSAVGCEPTTSDIVPGEFDSFVKSQVAQCIVKTKGNSKSIVRDKCNEAGKRALILGHSAFVDTNHSGIATLVMMDEFIKTANFSSSMKIDSNDFNAFRKYRCEKLVDYSTDRNLDNMEIDQARIDQYIKTVSLVYSCAEFNLDELNKASN